MRSVLIIGYVWPEPKSSAAGTRMLELVQYFLEQNIHVTFASAAALSPHRFELGQWNVREVEIKLNCSSFDHFVAELQPDLVLFDRFFTEEQFGWRVEQSCPQALRILDSEDLHSLRHARHQLLKAEQRLQENERARQSVGPVSSTSEALFAQMAQDDMAQREIAAIYRCDLTLIISTYEMSLLQDYFGVPESLLHYCPFLTSPSGSDTALPHFAQRQHFVTIGNFRHEPNWDAVLWLKHQLWPMIHAQLPQAELHIYGAYPPPKATQLHNPGQGFHVKGWAADVGEIMRNTRVCLAPLRFGAGIKGKLMDACYWRTPSVTTSIGAEGFCSDVSWPGMIADEAAAFVAGATQLYQDQNSWNKWHGAIEPYLQHLFSIDQQSRLRYRLQSLLANISSERCSNFVGQMLRHHNYQSLRFKSLWIEAKNR